MFTIVIIRSYFGPIDTLLFVVQTLVLSRLVANSLCQRKGLTCNYLIHLQRDLLFSCTPPCLVETRHWTRFWVCDWTKIHEWHCPLSQSTGHNKSYIVTHDVLYVKHGIMMLCVQDINEHAHTVYPVHKTSVQVQGGIVLSLDVHIAKAWPNKYY